jgi:transposase
MAVPGHSFAKRFLPQINQVYVLSLSPEGTGVPAFYRNVAGNIPDVSAFDLTVMDAGIEKATVIADAGFASEENFTMLKEAGLDYVVPLRRNTSATTLEGPFGEVFTYHHRAISARVEKKDGYRVIVFRDEKLRADEMADFVKRSEKANAAAAKRRDFDPDRDLRDIAVETAEKLPYFGVIVLRTSLMEPSASKIYDTYKLRGQVEQLFDTMRNDCGGDASYMRDDPGFEAWSFINHVTLIAASRVFSKIRAADISKDWSLTGVMDHLSRVHKVRIGDKWLLAETTQKTRGLLKLLGIDLGESKTKKRKRGGGKTSPVNAAPST